MLVIAGAQRSATTAVVRWFADCGRVRQFGRQDELFAFEGPGHRLWTAVVKWQVRRAVTRGELPLFKRPEIFHIPSVGKRAAAAFPDAVALVLLRHPVERAVSAWQHNIRIGVLAPTVGITDCLTAFRRSGSRSLAGQVVSYSQYSEPAARFLANFPGAHVFFYENVTVDPRGAFAPVLERLGLSQLPAEVLPVRNRHDDLPRLGTPGSGLSARLSYRWNDKEEYMAPRRAGHVLGTTVRLGRAILHRSNAPVPRATAGDRAALLDVVSPDLPALEAVLGQQVPHGWRRLPDCS